MRWITCFKDCSGWQLQLDGRCPIPGNIQGQVEGVSEQPDLVEDVAANCRGGGLAEL